MPSLVSSRKSTARGALVLQDARGLLRDQLLEALELHRRRLAGLAPRLQEAVEQRPHRAGRRAVTRSRRPGPRFGARRRRASSASSGELRRSARRRGGRRRRWRRRACRGAPSGAAFLERAQPLGPQLVEGVVARGQRLVAETLGVVADLGVGVLADQRLERVFSSVGRLPLEPAEELLPLDLELADRPLERSRSSSSPTTLALPPRGRSRTAAATARARTAPLAVHQHLGARIGADELEELAQQRRAARVEGRVVHDGPRLAASPRRPGSAAPAPARARSSGPSKASNATPMRKGAAGGRDTGCRPSRRRGARCPLPPSGRRGGSRSAKVFARSRPPPIPLRCPPTPRAYRPS